MSWRSAFQICYPNQDLGNIWVTEYLAWVKSPRKYTD